MPAKTGLPVWGKVVLGCGIAFLAVVVTCVGAGAFLIHRFKKDPDGFKHKALSLVADKMHPDWEDFRAVVEQLRSPEGCQALYSANPSLANTWPTEAAFLETTSRWHKDIVSAPELTPEVMEHRAIQINHTVGRQVRVSWRPPSGLSVSVTFEKARDSGDKGPRRVAELDVH